MKRIMFILFAISFIFVFTGCESDSTEGNKAPGNPQPIYPGNNDIDIPNLIELQWECEDSDGDNLTYNVYMGKTEENMEIIASEISETVFTPDTLDYKQRYHWKVRANDGQETTSSIPWKFNTIEENMPPAIPGTPNPQDGTIDIEPVSVLFRWWSYDVNGGNPVYDFYLGKDENPALMAENLTDKEYSVADLDYHTWYYWKIVAKSDGMETEGPVWCFETRYYNYPPDNPHTPYPYDGSEDISIGADLNWQCSDPEDDDLLYDIYIGTDTNPPLFYQNFTSTTYHPEGLESFTTYYWKIAAFDGNNYSHGSVWSFTTGASNLPPNEPYLPWPENNALDESIYAMLRWSCNDPDGDDLMYKVYFGVVPDLNEDHVIALGITDENFELNTLNYGTTYYWKITAHDGEMLTTGPVWNFTTENFNR